MLEIKNMTTVETDPIASSKLVNTLAGVRLPLSDPDAPGALAADPPLIYDETLQAELTEANERLLTASPQEILQYAVDRFAPRFSMATAFGPEGMCIIAMLAEIAPDTPVFNLDTGYQFKETLNLVDRVRERYGISVELRRAKLSVEEYERANGGPVYTHNPNQCCGDRKLAVLRDASKGLYAWASAIRKSQSEDRAKTSIVQWDHKFQLVKISPLLNWTKQNVWSFISKNEVPYNELHDQNFPSVGCWPCTRATTPGEDERAGRWSGSGKTECGLHSRND
jgi:phosphoadenosine phosphosulfate reductase